MGSQISKNQLKINILSGDCQSYQLYDHHSNNILEQTSILKFPSYIAQTQQGLKYSYEKSCQNTYQIDMPRNNQIKICSTKNYNQNSSLWRIIKIDDVQELDVNDIIKIGKLKFKIKQIKMPGRTHKFLQTSIIQTEQLSRTLNKNFDEISSQKSKQEICKFCFSNHHSNHNPLINLCKCSGSMKLIHFQCLKDWLNKNLVKRQTPNYLFYSFTQAKCQVCLQPLNNQFQYEGKKYSLFDIQKIHPPYIAIECKEKKQDRKQIISLYYIKLIQGQQINLGRSHQCEVMVKDISVSRIHCSFTMENKRVYIRDKGSKFGTLIKLQNQIEFSSEKGLQLQYKTKIIKIHKQLSLNTNCCCIQGQFYTLYLQNSQKLIGIGKKSRIVKTITDIEL